MLMPESDNDFGILVETTFNLEPYLRAAIANGLVVVDSETKKISVNNLIALLNSQVGRGNNQVLESIAGINTSYTHSTFSIDWINSHRKAIIAFLDEEDVYIKQLFTVTNSPLVDVTDMTKEDAVKIRSYLYTIANRDQYRDSKIEHIANISNIKTNNDEDVRVQKDNVEEGYLVSSLYRIYFRSAYKNMKDNTNSFIGSNVVKLCSGMRINLCCIDRLYSATRLKDWLGWPDGETAWSLVFTLALYPDQYKVEHTPKDDKNKVEYDSVVTIPSDSGSIVDTAFHSLIPTAESMDIFKVMRFLYFTGDGKEFDAVENMWDRDKDKYEFSYTPHIKNHSDNDVEIVIKASKWQHWDSQFIWNVDAYIKCLNDAKEDLEKISSLFKKFRTLRARVKDKQKPELFEYFREYIKKRIIADPECIQGKSGVPDNIRNVTKLILGNAAESGFDFDDLDSDAEEEDKSESVL